MENDERKSIAKILALDLPQKNSAPETALFTWHSDLRAWQCRNIHDKISLCKELRMSSWTCVESRLANLRLVRDRADAAVESGISLLYLGNHCLFRKYVFYGPHLDFHLVRRSVVLHLSDVLNIDFATLYPLLQQVCDIKHFLYFAGIHDNDNVEANATNHQQRSSSYQPKQQTAHNNETDVFTWENLRHIWKFYVTPHMDHQKALTTLANTVNQPILFIQNQFYNLEKLEKHIDTVLHEGVTLLPGSDTDLWESFRRNHPIVSGHSDITIPLGFKRSQTIEGGPQIQRLALIRALKRFLYIADVHGQVDLTPSTPAAVDSRGRKLTVVYTIAQLQLMYQYRSLFLSDKLSTINELASSFQREQSSVRNRMDDLLKMEKCIDNLVLLDNVTLLPGPDAILWKLFRERSGSLSVPVYVPAQHVADVLHQDVVSVRARLIKIRALKKHLLIANIYDDTTPLMPSSVYNIASTTTTHTAEDSNVDTFDDGVSVISLGAYSDNDHNNTNSIYISAKTTIAPDWESVLNMELLFDDVAMTPLSQHNLLNHTNGNNNSQLDMECDSMSELSMPLDVTDYVDRDIATIEPLVPAATDAVPSYSNVTDVTKVTAPITGHFLLAEDQLIWQSWNQQPLRNRTETQEWMRNTATQLNRRGTTVQTRVNYLLRLEQQVNNIVAEGASFLPSSITELYSTYISISGDTRVNCKTVDVTAAKRLQYALQPPYSIYSVLQEVKLVKWYLWLRDIHNDKVGDYGGPELSVCTDPAIETVSGTGNVSNAYPDDITSEAVFLCDVVTLCSDTNSGMNEVSMCSLEAQSDTTASSQPLLTPPSVSAMQFVSPALDPPPTSPVAAIANNNTTFTTLQEEQIWQTYLQHQKNHHLSLPFLLTNLAQRYGSSYEVVNMHLQMMLLGQCEESKYKIGDSSSCVGNKRDQCSGDIIDGSAGKRRKCI